MPEIMIPLVGTVKEFDHTQKNIIVETAEKVMKAQKSQGRLHGRHHDRDPARRR